MESCCQNLLDITVIFFNGEHIYNTLILENLVLLFMKRNYLV